MKKYICCDLSETNLRAAIVDVDASPGAVLHQLTVPTLAREGYNAVMKRMADLSLEVIHSAGMKKEEIGGIGIGVPGMLDLELGETLFLPNLPGCAGYLVNARFWLLSNTTTVRWQNLSSGLIKAVLWSLNQILIYAKVY